MKIIVQGLGMLISLFIVWIKMNLCQNKKNINLNFLIKLNVKWFLVREEILKDIQFIVLI